MKTWNRALTSEEMIAVTSWAAMDERKPQHMKYCRVYIIDEHYSTKCTGMFLDGGVISNDVVFIHPGVFFSHKGLLCTGSAVTFWRELSWRDPRDAIAILSLWLMLKWGKVWPRIRRLLPRKRIDIMWIDKK